MKKLLIPLAPLLLLWGCVTEEVCDCIEPFESLPVVYDSVVVTESDPLYVAPDSTVSLAITNFDDEVRIYHADTVAFVMPENPNGTVPEFAVVPKSSGGNRFEMFINSNTYEFYVPYRYYHASFYEKNDTLRVTWYNMQVLYD